MPRVTFEEFYARHNQLKKAWEDPISHFLSLEAHEQWYIHDYYRPSEKLTKDELYKHWRMLHENPTPLHQQAGRACARLKPFLEGQPYYLVSPDKQATSSKNIQVVARGQVHPRLDVESMVYLVTMMAEQLRDEAKKSTEAES